MMHQSLTNNTQPAYFMSSSFHITLVRKQYGLMLKSNLHNDFLLTFTQYKDPLKLDDD